MEQYRAYKDLLKKVNILEEGVASLKSDVVNFPMACVDCLDPDIPAEKMLGHIGNHGNLDAIAEIALIDKNSHDSVIAEAAARESAALEEAAKAEREATAAKAKEAAAKAEKEKAEAAAAKAKEAAAKAEKEKAEAAAAKAKEAAAKAEKEKAEAAAAKAKEAAAKAEKEKAEAAAAKAKKEAVAAAKAKKEATAGAKYDKEAAAGAKSDKEAADGAKSDKEAADGAKSDKEAADGAKSDKEAADANAVKEGSVILEKEVGALVKRKVKKGSKTSFPCLSCGEDFTSEDDRKKHRKAVHFGGEDGKLICLDCDPAKRKTFSKQKCLNDHFRSTHYKLEWRNMYKQSE